MAATCMNAHELGNTEASPQQPSHNHMYMCIYPYVSLFCSEFMTALIAFACFFGIQTKINQDLSDTWPGIQVRNSCVSSLY